MPADHFLLVVGLGNPGPTYAQTRHNLGFLVIDELAKRIHAGPPHKKFQSALQEGMLLSTKILLLKPQTFMNLSGEAVQATVHFHKLDPSAECLVVSDDLDLPPGKVRIRLSGGAGGHNGLKSIIECLGTEAFPRLRIGIGRDPNVPSETYVLSKIKRAELPIYDEAVQKAADAVEIIVKEGFSKAMDAFNKDPKGAL